MTVINERAAELRRRANQASDLQANAAGKLASHLLAVRHYALALDQTTVDELLDEFQRYRSEWAELTDAYMRARHANRYEEDPSVGEVDCG